MPRPPSRMPEPLRILAGEDQPSMLVEPKPRTTGLTLDES